MSRLLFLCALSIALQLCTVHPVDADSYRCGRKLVRTGDSSAAVRRICGEPRLKDRGIERVVVEGAAQQVTVERWYYKQSGRSLEHIVMLYRGRVIAIVAGGR